MSFSEIPGSNTGDQPKPKSANPPVPLQDIEKQGKQFASMEAAHTAALQDEQSNAAATLDAELAGLDASEVAQEREKELCQWIECTPEMANFRPVETAAKACQEAESECRELIDPEYDITQDIDEAVSVASEAIAEVSDEVQGDENENNVAEKTERNTYVEEVAGDPEVPALLTQSNNAKAEHDVVKQERDATGQERSAVADVRMKTAEEEAETIDIQSKYQELRQNHSQTETLQLLLRDQEISDKHRERLQNILNTISQLQAVVPAGEQKAFDDVLERSNLNLAAASPVAIFAEFISHVDSSPELSNETKTKIHETLHHKHHIKTASDAEKAILEQGRGVEKDENGNPKTLDYDKKHQLDMGGGIGLYRDGKSIIIDAGSWVESVSPEHLPHLRRWIALARLRKMADKEGIDNFFGYVFDSPNHTPHKYLRKFEKVLHNLSGGARGLDNALYTEEELNRIAHIVKFIGHFGEAPMKADESEMARSYEALGIEVGSSPLDVKPEGILKEVGSYFQEYPHAHGRASFDDLQKRLQAKFPEKNRK